MRHWTASQHRTVEYSAGGQRVEGRERAWIRYATLAVSPAVLPRVLFALMGFVPIGSLCIALFGLVPLYLSARFVVLPICVLLIALGLRYRALGRAALLGFVAGVTATGVYDLVRLALVLSGRWSDFIPAIGQMALLDRAASPVWGYLWRYAGDGGAMGLTFALLPWRSIRSGMVYGAGICSCLFATLILAPGAQQALFALTPLTAAMALLGHLVYGGVLGWALCRLTARYG